MSNTRVAVRLSQEAYDAISTISEISGTPRGQILAQALEAAIPGFIAIATAYKAAQAVEGEERAAILAGMEKAAQALYRALSEHGLDIPDTDGRTDGDTRAQARGALSDPPVTNRGVQKSNRGGLQ